MNIRTFLVGVFAAYLIAQCSAAPQLVVEGQAQAPRGGGVVNTLAGILKAVLGVVGLDDNRNGVFQNVLGSAVLGVRSMGDGASAAAAAETYTGDEPLSSLKEVDKEGLEALTKKIIKEQKAASSSSP